MPIGKYESLGYGHEFKPTDDGIELKIAFEPLFELLLDLAINGDTIVAHREEESFKALHAFLVFFNFLYKKNIIDFEIRGSWILFFLLTKASILIRSRVSGLVLVGHAELQALINFGGEIVLLANYLAEKQLTISNYLRGQSHDFYVYCNEPKEKFITLTNEFFIENPELANYCMKEEIRTNIIFAVSFMFHGFYARIIFRKPILPTVDLRMEESKRMEATRLKAKLVKEGRLLCLKANIAEEQLLAMTTIDKIGQTLNECSAIHLLYRIARYIRFNLVLQPLTRPDEAIITTDDLFFINQSLKQIVECLESAEEDRFLFLEITANLLVAFLLNQQTFCLIAQQLTNLSLLLPSIVDFIRAIEHSSSCLKDLLELDSLDLIKKYPSFFTEESKKLNKKELLNIFFQKMVLAFSIAIS